MRDLRTARLYAEMMSDGARPAVGTYATRSTGVKIAGRDVLFGIDSQYHLHLFLPAGARVVEDLKSSGVRLTANELEEGSQRWRFADLACTRTHLGPTFHLLSEEILQSLADDESHPDRIAIRTLDRWRELLGRPPSAPLGGSELAGLYAELVFLSEMLGRRSESLAAWTGPLKQRHDFSFSAASVEVKASLSSQRSIVRVNGFEQLTPTAGRSLYLLHIRLEIAEDGTTVPDLVRKVAEAGADSNTLYTLLAKLSYYPEHEEQYNQYRFREMGFGAYTVANNFPKLSSESFVGGAPPPAVVGVIYTLDLTQAAKWRLTSDAWAAVVAGL